MPQPYTRADAIRLLHTGAGSDSAAQTDPSAVLGNYCSSSRSGGRSSVLDTAQVGVRVDFVSGANPLGTGILTAVGDSQLTWAAPGGEQGPAVQIANGETRLIEDGAEPDQFIVVTRTSSQPLSGSSSVRVVETINNAVAHDNANVSSGPTYRCIGFRAGNAVIQSLKIWIANNDHPIAIAKEDPASQPAGAVQTIASETTAPTGLTFVSPDSSVHADVITVAQLNPGEWIGIWIRRDLSAVTDATPWAETALGWQYAAIG